MKKYFYILFSCLVSFATLAQEVDDVPPQDDQSAKEKIKAARIGLITQRLGLTPEQAEKFWPIYNEFASKRQELVKQYRQAERTAPSTSDPKQQEALVNLGLKLKQDELSLEKEYSGKMMNVISAQQILNLRQAEREFRKIILNQLQQRRMLQDRKENFRDRNMKLRERKH